MRSRTFVIVGLGLIGASLGAAIRKYVRGSRVVGVSRSQHKIRVARKRKLIHAGHTRLAKALQHADLVFICTPVDTIPSLMIQVDRHAKPGTVVTDVGSTKQAICRWADRQRFRNIQFVGAHPLAGSHLSGLSHSRADLFRNAFVFLTPTGRTRPRARRLVASVWRKLKAVVCVLSPQTHDRIVSEVSHMPHAIAICMMNMIAAASLRYAGAGFRDSTRVAQGSPEIWRPIFLSNRVCLLRDLHRFSQSLNRFTHMLRHGSKAGVQKALRTASRRRSRL